jgi:hypothetical protein
METINTIQLGDESIFPNESILTGVLGRSYRAYCVLLELFDQNEMTPEWRYYRDGKAWLCKVQKMKRTIVWMSAWKGFMKATIYVPLRHMDGVFALPISEDTKAHFRATKNVGQSKPCIFEVRNQKVLKDLNTVMQFKIRTR